MHENRRPNATASTYLLHLFAFASEWVKSRLLAVVQANTAVIFIEETGHGCLGSARVGGL